MPAMENHIQSLEDVDKLLCKCDIVFTGMNDVLQQIFDVMHRRDSILITGESGTGKDMVADAVHMVKAAAGYQTTLVKRNIAAIPSTLIESELFGHKKGAFTGAVSERKGVFEVANGGRLFLDEIGELTSDIQAKLLRVLENGTFEPVGSNKTITTDVQVLSATSTSKSEESIRTDLLHRLSANTIQVPPLDDRPYEAKKSLITALFRKKAPQTDERTAGKGVGVTVDTGAINVLSEVRFPGNVRELSNIIAGVFNKAVNAVPAYGNMDHIAVKQEHAESVLASRTEDTKETPEPVQGWQFNGDVTRLSAKDLEEGANDRIFEIFVRKLRRVSVAELARVMGISNPTAAKKILDYAERHGCQGELNGPEILVQIHKKLTS